MGKQVGSGSHLIIKFSSAGFCGGPSGGIDRRLAFGPWQERETFLKV